MSRELKFRVWNKISKEYTYFDTPRFTLQDKPGVSQIDFANVKYNKIMLSGYCEVEQYTGLKDIDGNVLDWWQGDTFAHPSGNGVIKWKDGGLYMHDQSGYTPIGEAARWHVSPKKTGNIHDKGKNETD